MLNDKEYQFSLKANSEESILVGESYSSRADCEKAIVDVRLNASYESRYERKASPTGYFYFHLKSGNGKTVGTSKLYISAWARDNGIEAVKGLAPNGIIEHQPQEAFHSK